MIPIVCLSDDNGMAFNHRRQSRDEKLIAYLMDRTKDQTLRMSPYSAELFEKYRPIPEENVSFFNRVSDENSSTSNPVSKVEQSAGYDLIVEENYLENAGPFDYCFVEKEALKPYQDQIPKLILCRWNRKYPGDLKFDLDLSAYQMTSTEDIQGKSHDKITIEVWEKK